MTRHRIGSAATINPDDIKVHWFIVAGVSVSLLTAIITSWAGLTYVATWQGLPDYMTWLTPIMVDVPLVMLTLARGALKQRGRPTPWMLTGIMGLTLLSSAANFAHSEVMNGVGTLASAFGAGMNAFAPWMILGMTEVLWVVTTKPIKARRTGKRPGRKPGRPKATQGALEGVS